MHTVASYEAALLLGVIAGLRTFTPLAVVSWAASLGALSVAGTRLAVVGFRITAWILTALALFELCFDQVPSVPSRKSPASFTARLVSGAIVGATAAIGRASWAAGLVLGVIGAVIGTLGGAGIRARLARALRGDHAAALIEDAVAIGGAILIVAELR